MGLWQWCICDHLAHEVWLEILLGAVFTSGLFQRRTAYFGRRPTDGVEWRAGGFDDFAFKFSNWLFGLPGDAERLLEECANMGQPWATLAAREKVVARGVATALRALVGGNALSCIRHPEKQNGFEMWRVLHKEYKPDTATRKSGFAGKSDGRSACSWSGFQ